MAHRRFVTSQDAQVNPSAPTPPTHTNDVIYIDHEPQDSELPSLKRSVTSQRMHHLSSSEASPISGSKQNNGFPTGPRAHRMKEQSSSRRISSLSGHSGKKYPNEDDNNPYRSSYSPSPPPGYYPYSRPAQTSHNGYPYGTYQQSSHDSFPSESSPQSYHIYTKQQHHYHIQQHNHHHHHHQRQHSLHQHLAQQYQPYQQNQHTSRQQQQPPFFAQGTVAQISSTRVIPPSNTTPQGNSLASYISICTPSAESPSNRLASLSAPTISKRYSPSYITSSPAGELGIYTGLGPSEAPTEQVEIMDAIGFMLNYDPKDFSKLYFKEISSHEALPCIVSSLRESPEVVKCCPIKFESSLYIAVEALRKNKELAMAFSLKPITGVPFNCQSDSIFVRGQSADFCHKMAKNKAKYLDPFFKVYGGYTAKCAGVDLLLHGDKYFRLGLYGNRRITHSLGKLYVEIDLFQEVSSMVPLSDDEVDIIIDNESEEFEEITPHVQVVNSHEINVIEANNGKEEVTSSPKRKMKKFTTMKGGLLFDDKAPNKRRRLSPTSTASADSTPRSGLRSRTVSKSPKPGLIEDETPKKSKYFHPITPSRPSSSIKTKNTKDEKDDEEAEREIRELKDLDSSLKQARSRGSKNSKSEPIQVETASDISDDDLEPIDDISSEEETASQASRILARPNLPVVVPMDSRKTRLRKPYTLFNSDHGFSLRDIKSNYLIVRNVERDDYNLITFAKEIQKRISEPGSNLLQATYSSKYGHIALKLQGRTGVIAALERIHGYKFENGKTIKLAMCDEAIGKKVFGDCDQVIDIYRQSDDEDKDDNSDDVDVSDDNIDDDKDDIYEYND